MALNKWAAALVPLSVCLVSCVAGNPGCPAAAFCGPTGESADGGSTDSSGSIGNDSSSKDAGGASQDSTSTAKDTAVAKDESLELTVDPAVCEQLMVLDGKWVALDQYDEPGFGECSINLTPASDSFCKVTVKGEEVLFPNKTFFGKTLPLLEQENKDKLELAYDGKYLYFKSHQPNGVVLSNKLQKQTE